MGTGSTQHFALRIDVTAYADVELNTYIELRDLRRNIEHAVRTMLGTVAEVNVTEIDENE